MKKTFFRNDLSFKHRSEDIPVNQTLAVKLQPSLMALGREKRPEREARVADQHLDVLHQILFADELATDQPAPVNRVGIQSWYHVALAVLHVLFKRNTENVFDRKTRFNREIKNSIRARGVVSLPYRIETVARQLRRQFALGLGVAASKNHRLPSHLNKN